MITAEFPPVAKTDWEAQIQQDLKGADYTKKLVWKTDEGFNVQPYYTRDALDVLSFPTATAPGQFPFARGDGRPWEAVEPDHEPAADLDASGYHDNGATAVQEIAFLLAEGVEKLAASTKPIDESAPRMVARLGVGPIFFLEIAKLRAARLVWAEAVRAFSPKNDESAYLHIHARTARWNKTLYDENNNLLRATVEALAAVLGGADWLTVVPELFDARLALNVQRILREESHLDRVADAAGGSWYIEKLTCMLAVQSWILFQQIEAEGGFTAYQNSGKLEAAINGARTAKTSAYAGRRRVLVGINNYPNPNETVLAKADALNEAGFWRASGVFENARLRTEKHVAAGGKRPSVLLLEGGDVKMRRARATFCANFFGCAGFEIRESSALEPADLVVLCSSDPEYTAFAGEVIPKAKSPVLVAGNPKESIETLQASGVAGFIHIGSTLVDTITEWQNKLGVKA